MHKALYSFCLFISINFLVYTQVQTKNVTFFGSSVCRGTGAENNEGYAWQFFHNGAIDTLKYKYFNASRGGDNTIKIERDNRMAEDLFPTNPDIVVIGLSLGNEGINWKAKNDNDRELILEQFRSRLLTMADSLNNLNIKPIIVNCYAHGHFNDSHYEFTKKMNRIINTWNYPSINVLGTIDDLKGKWVKEFENDPWHPNTAGHQEMSYAIVPSLFDAVMQGKKTPKYDWNPSYNTVTNKDQVKNPLSIEIENTMHSFTLSFRFKESSFGSIAGFSSNESMHSINVANNTIYYKDISTQFPLKQEKQIPWNHVVLSHSYANKKTTLYLNGEKVGSMNEQLSPTQISFGGNVKTIKLKDVSIHRSALNDSEALDLFNKKFIQSSLEFYNPLTKPQIGNYLENYAQSLSVLTINSKVELNQTNVKLTN